MFTLPLMNTEFIILYLSRNPLPEKYFTNRLKIRKIAIFNISPVNCIHQRKCEHYQLHEPNAFGKLVG